MSCLQLVIVIVIFCVQIIRKDEENCVKSNSLIVFDKKIEDVSINLIRLRLLMSIVCTLLNYEIERNRNRNCTDFRIYKFKFYLQGEIFILGISLLAMIKTLNSCHYPPYKGIMGGRDKNFQVLMSSSKDITQTLKFFHGTPFIYLNLVFCVQHILLMLYQTISSTIIVVVMFSLFILVSLVSSDFGSGSTTRVIIYVWFVKAFII